jgi:hypothetical protein
LLLALLFVDYDTRNDLVPFLAVSGVGVGPVVGRSGRALRERAASAVGSRQTRATARRAVAVVVCAMALVSVVTFGGYGTGDTGLDDVAVYDTAERVGMGIPYTLAERQQLYWHGHETPTCRVFVGRTQYDLVQRLGLSDDPDVRYWEPDCGRFGPTWRAVREKYGLDVPTHGRADGVLTPTPEPTPTATATGTPPPEEPPTLTPSEGRNGTATPAPTTAPTGCPPPPVAFCRRPPHPRPGWTTSQSRARRVSAASPSTGRRKTTR